MSVTISQAEALLDEGRRARAFELIPCPYFNALPRSEKFWWARGWTREHDRILRERSGDSPATA